MKREDAMRMTVAQLQKYSMVQLTGLFSINELEYIGFCEPNEIVGNLPKIKRSSNMYYIFQIYLDGKEYDTYRIPVALYPDQPPSESYAFERWFEPQFDDGNFTCKFIGKGGGSA